MNEAMPGFARRGQGQVSRQLALKGTIIGEPGHIRMQVPTLPEPIGQKQTRAYISASLLAKDIWDRWGPACYSPQCWPRPGIKEGWAEADRV